MAIFTTTQSGKPTSKPASGVTSPLTTKGLLPTAVKNLGGSIVLNKQGSVDPGSGNSQTTSSALKPGQFSMGVPAKAVEQNISKPSTVLPPAQVKTVATQPTGNTSKAPNAQPENQPTTGMPVTGVNLSNGNSTLQTPGAMGVTQTPTPPTATQPAQNAQPSPYTANSGLYGQLITGIANRYGQASPEYKQAQQDLNTSVQNRNQLQSDIAKQYGLVESQPIPLEFQQGREQVMARQYAGQLDAAQQAVTQAQSGLGYANTQQGLQQGALGTALGAAGTTLSGGQYMPYGGDNAGFAAGLDRQRQVDTYNYNTQTGLGFGGQAAQLDQPMQALSTLGPQMADYLQKTGINQNTAVMANSLVNGGLAQTNPGAYAILKFFGSEAQNTIAQIAGMNATLIPTDITDKAHSMSVENMSPKDILAFVQAANIAAQPRYSALKSSSASALNSGTTAYTGQTQANPTAQVPATPTPTTLIGNQPNTNDPWANAAIGVGTSLLNIGNAASFIFGAIAKRFGAI